MTEASPPSSDSTRQTIAILGMGAIGTLMAWHWRTQDLFCITRGGHSCERFFEDRQGNQHTLSLPHWSHSPLDWLVITTKAASTLSALRPLHAWLPRINNILLLQNGMGQQQQVADWLNQFRQAPQLWVGISTEGAYRSSPQQVVWAGSGETCIGPWSEAADSTTRILPNTQPVSDIHTRMRAKLAINAVINPMTAALQCRNGELVSNDQYFQQMTRLADEIQWLYQQLEWPLDFSLAQRAADVAQATANNRSSSLQDVLSQRPTELNYITGFLLQQARQHQLSLPHSEHWLQQLGERSHNE
jgi:2-dehydropantoate 2-reductase